MILLVDDDVQFLQNTDRLLNCTWHVLFARDGYHALQLARMIEFSIALVDLCLPGANGFDVIQELHWAYPELPIVAISGVWSGPVLESAKEFGAVAVLSKPATNAWI